MPLNTFSKTKEVTNIDEGFISALMSSCGHEHRFV